MQNIGEIWKPVKGWKNFYEVSNMGRVRSLDRVMIAFGSMFIKEGRILKARPNADGYLKVDLKKSSKTATLYVHRLVAIAFLPNPNHKPEVNHKKGDKNDNRSVSLEWVTGSENIYHSWRAGLRSRA